MNYIEHIFFCNKCKNVFGVKCDYSSIQSVNVEDPTVDIKFSLTPHVHCVVCDALSKKTIEIKDGNPFIINFTQTLKQRNPNFIIKSVIFDDFYNYHEIIFKAPKKIRALWRKQTSLALLNPVVIDKKRHIYEYRIIIRESELKFYGDSVISIDRVLSEMKLW